MNDKNKDRYSRQIMLESIGEEGQQILLDSSVCVVGCGGLGTPIVTKLVAMGVGKIKIIDRDFVEMSNLHRQHLFREEDLHKAKCGTAKESLLKLNSDCKIDASIANINDDNALKNLVGYDVIVDALDSVETRYAVNMASQQLLKPLVSGAAAGTSGQVMTIIPQIGTACYNCNFKELDSSNAPVCGRDGVDPSVLSIVAGIQVSETVRLITGKVPQLVNTIMNIQLDGLNFTKTRTYPDKECSHCKQGLGRYE